MHPYIQAVFAGIVTATLIAIAVNTSRIADALEKQVSPPKPVACKLT